MYYFKINYSSKLPENEEKIARESILSGEFTKKLGNFDPLTSLNRVFRDQISEYVDHFSK